ncbi:unnamed protein product, partial [Ectocarpus sp. 13 AM-2016]
MRKPSRCMSRHRSSERRCWAQSTLVWPHRSTTGRCCWSTTASTLRASHCTSGHLRCSKRLWFGSPEFCHG